MMRFLDYLYVDIVPDFYLDDFIDLGGSVTLQDVHTETDDAYLCRYQLSFYGASVDADVTAYKGGGCSVMAFPAEHPLAFHFYLQYLDDAQELEIRQRRLFFQKAFYYLFLFLVLLAVCFSMLSVWYLLRADSAVSRICSYLTLVTVLIGKWMFSRRYWLHSYHCKPSLLDEIRGFRKTAA